MFVKQKKRKTRPIDEDDDIMDVRYKKKELLLHDWSSFRILF